MASPPRILLPGYLTFITTRVEEGLPFVPTKYMELLVFSVLARAQLLYPVTICALCLMANHLHLLLVVRDPEQVALFMDRIKTELSHAINKLRGRRKRTVWCDSYDAVPILTLKDAIDKFVYVYTNPQTARLATTIDDYPGISTWNMFLSENNTIQAPWIQRPSIPRLKKSSVNPAEDRALAEKLRAGARESNTFSIDPFAWLECYDIKEDEKSHYKQRIVNEVRATEECLNLTRSGKCADPEQLKRQPIDKPYTPKKFSRRMWCICGDIDLKIAFILMIKSRIRKGREVYQRWKRGDFSVPYPPELFAPRFPRVLA